VIPLLHKALKAIQGTFHSLDATGVLQFRDISTGGLEFIRPPQGIFAKLVTKVAKQSSLKVVSLQNAQEIPVGEGSGRRSDSP
jgi:hypothetical protein